MTDRAGAKYIALCLCLALVAAGAYWIGGLVMLVKVCGAIALLYIGLKNSSNGLFLVIVLLPVVSDTTMIILIACAIFFSFFEAVRLGKINRSEPAMVGMLLLIAVLVAAATVFSISPSASLRDFVLHIISIALVLSLVFVRREKRDLHKMLVAILLSALICSLYGLWQYIAGVPMESGWVDANLNPDITTRVFAFFENPNIFSEYLVLFLPLTVALFVVARRKMERAAFFALGMGMLLALVLTLSRGGYLAFAFSLGVFILLVRGRYIVYLVTCGILCIPLLPSTIIDRLLTIGSADSSSAYRLVLWNGALNMIQDFGAYGIGIGYKVLMKITSFYYSGLEPYHLHNTFLELFVETGFLGLALFLVLAFMVIRTGARTMNSGGSRYYRVVAAALTSGFCGLWVQGMVEHILFNPKIIVYFYLVIGLVIICLTNSREERLKTDAAVESDTKAPDAAIETDPAIETAPDAGADIATGVEGVTGTEA